MASVFRYNELTLVGTPLDPVEDMCSMISGLQSSGYTTDLLRERHKHTSAREISQCGKLVSAYARDALGLLEQAYSGPPEVSFLPLYYALLNLSKICVIAAHMRAPLQGQRVHGATYTGITKNSHDLMTETFVLKPRGAIPLFYRALTGETWGQNDMPLQMRDIYPYIVNISFEFYHCYGGPSALCPCTLQLDQVRPGRCLNLELMPTAHPNGANRRYLKVTRGLSEHPNRPRVYTSKTFVGTEAQAISVLTRPLRRYLLYLSSVSDSHDAMFLTPISSRRLLLPEELPIILAFYHMSNIVRYKADFLAQLQDSRCWPMLLALRKHAGLRFLLLFWSFMQQSSYWLFHG